MVGAIMTRQDIINACAAAVLELFDPYDLADIGGSWEDATRETLHLLETDPAVIASWLHEIRG